MNLSNTIGAIGFLSVVAACGNATKESTIAVEPASSPARSAAAPQAPTVAPAPQKPPATRKLPAAAVGRATKAFLDRVAEYVSFHNNVEKMVPPLNETSDPAKISAREQALGAALIKTRPDAKPGDFFITEIQPYLTQIIKEDFARRPLADRKALIVELPKGVTVNVNEVYPTEQPLATFPGNLLEKLPELPPELEYRIVGRDLVLRDVKGNVVVDIMRKVFPIPV